MAWHGGYQWPVWRISLGFWLKISKQALAWQRLNGG